MDIGKADKISFLFKEYESAQQLTFHLDNLRAKLTQFFVTFTGISIAGLTILLKGETTSSYFDHPEVSIVVLSFFTAIVGSLFVVIIARLRSAQLEHFRIVNNIRELFLGNDIKL